MGEMISFNKFDGGMAQGYLANAENPLGAVVVIQEWWGLNDQIKGMADRLAAARYTALAPDLYEGRVTQDPDEANHMMTGMDWDGAYKDIRGAVQYLKRVTGKVGVMGFCMGGALTVIAGVKVPETDAAVCFYGIPDKAAADPAEMQAPFQGHFAGIDDWCTPDAVNGLDADLSAVATPVQIYRYDRSQHGFMNEARADVYDAEAAELAWDRALSFLGEHL